MGANGVDAVDVRPIANGLVKPHRLLGLAPVFAVDKEPTRCSNWVPIGRMPSASRSISVASWQHPVATGRQQRVVGLGEQGGTQQARICELRLHQPRAIQSVMLGPPLGPSGA